MLRPCMPGQGDGSAPLKTAPAPTADEQEASGGRRRLRSHSTQSRSEASLTSSAPYTSQRPLCCLHVWLFSIRLTEKQNCQPWLCCSFVFCNRACSALQALWQGVWQVTGTAADPLSAVPSADVHHHHAECPCRSTHLESQDGGRKRKAAASPSQGRDGSWEPASKRKQRADSKRPALQGGTQRPGSQAASQQPAVRPFGRTAAAKAGPRADPQGEPHFVMPVSTAPWLLSKPSSFSWAARQQQARLLKCYVKRVHMRTQLGFQLQQSWQWLCTKPAPTSLLLHPGGQSLHAAVPSACHVLTPDWADSLIQVGVPFRRSPWRAHPC